MVNTKSDFFITLRAHNTPPLFLFPRKHCESGQPFRQCSNHEIKLYYPPKLGWAVGTVFFVSSEKIIIKNDGLDDKQVSDREKPKMGSIKVYLLFFFVNYAASEGKHTL